MFTYTKTDPTLLSASWEILILLGVTFLLGYLLRFVLESNYPTNKKLPPVVRSQRLVVTEQNIDGAKFATSDTSKSAKEVFGKNVKNDDLKIVEGIGPKIEGLLHAAKIKTWKDLANVSIINLKRILDKAGKRYAMHGPETWPQQAALAHDGQWSELKKLQRSLK